MDKKILSSLILGLSVVVLGAFVYAGIVKVVNKDRQVVVRGLAEREVMADKVTWPLVFKITGNDLTEVYTQINSKNNTVVKFLTDNGIRFNEISVNTPAIYDRDAQSYRSDAAFRYTMTQVVIVSSSNVTKVIELMQKQTDLIKQGITLSADYSYQTEFEYTSLNDIKPEMIAQATSNAREAAAKFAEDSHSSVGRIKSATQGQFSISNRDAYTPWIKNVRVVTTVTYSLD